MMTPTKTTVLLFGLSLVAPVFGQTVYKCPLSGSGFVFQQMPCSPIGGGETVQVRALKPGKDGGLRASEVEYLDEIAQLRKEQAEAAKAESDRQDALAVERAKANAAYAQARAAESQASAVREQTQVMAGRRR